jgi:hypothetical protein
MNDRPHPTDYEEGRPHKGQYRDNSPMGWLSRPVVFVPLILLVLFGIILLLVSSSKNRQLRDAEERAALEREEVVDRANQRITENNTYFLRTMMMPFAWAVRTAMLSGNVEQVDQYLYQFVQEPNFDLILVADPKGKIISTTNQKYKGEDFTNHFEPDLLRADETVVDATDSTSIKVATPVMGLTSKLGTLYVVYTPEEPLALRNE